LDRKDNQIAKKISNLKKQITKKYRSKKNTKIGDVLVLSFFAFIFLVLDFWFLFLFPGCNMRVVNFYFITNR